MSTRDIAIWCHICRKAVVTAVVADNRTVWEIKLDASIPEAKLLGNGMLLRAFTDLEAEHYTRMGKVGHLILKKR